MNEGAVALIDCLGFKGVWQRGEADTVLRELRAIMNGAQDALNHGIFSMAREKGARLRVSFLSDTVVIGADAARSIALSNSDRGRLIIIASQVAQYASAKLLQMSTPLASRGCVTYGLFDMNDTFLIGPAIDRAAELHEMAQGAFIWVAPQFDGLVSEARRSYDERLRQETEPFDDLLLIMRNVVESYASPQAVATFDNELGKSEDEQKNRARKALREFLLSNPEMFNLIRYGVPLKGGSVINCWAANPESPFVSPVEVYLKYLNAMAGDSIDVTIKRQNTEAFLKHARKTNESLLVEWQRIWTRERAQQCG